MQKLSEEAFGELGPELDVSTVPSLEEVPNEHALRRAKFFALGLVYGSPSAKELDDLARSTKGGAKSQLDLLAGTAGAATSSKSASARGTAGAAASSKSASGLRCGEPVGAQPSCLHPGHDLTEASAATAATPSAASSALHCGEPVGAQPSCLHPDHDPISA